MKKQVSNASDVVKDDVLVFKAKKHVADPVPRKRKGKASTHKKEIFVGACPGPGSK